MLCRKSLIVVLFMIMFTGAFAARMSRIDTLRYLLNKAVEDSDKVKRLLDIAAHYNAMDVADDEGIQSAQQALALSQKNKYYKWENIAYLNMALYYELKGDNSKALDNFLKAEDCAEKHNNIKYLASIYGSLSNFYLEQIKNTKKALEYSLKGLQIAKQMGARSFEANALVGVGNIYYNANEYKQSLDYYLQALDILDSLGAQNSAATVDNNIGSSYSGLNEYDKSVEYYQKALNIYRKLDNTDGVATALANIGNVYNMKGDTKQGIQYSLEALPMARKVHDDDLVDYIYSFLAEGYSKTGNYKKAYDYQVALSNLKDTLFNDASVKQVNDMQVKYDTEKKEKENKILELSVNRQKLINYSVSVGLLLVLTLAFFVYRGYMNKKKAHEELAEKNKIIEEKNKDILDSINYAKTIQHAILTQPEYLKESLDDYFIVYKPRDVVSGDFYWCHTVGDKVVVTVADCTGHGVPGAFMSMIGNSLLNEVVIENKITDAAQILNALRAGILKTLQQKGQGSVKRDGMDITLCVWDKNKNSIEYAGANSPLYLVRKDVNGSLENNGKIKFHTNELAEILPDKQPIGYLEGKTETPFTSFSFSLKKGDIIYLSSDGFADQFGGESGKKYTKKKFRETLSALSGLDLNEQKDRMNRIIDDWKGNEFQTDDICVMGIRFS